MTSRPVITSYSIYYTKLYDALAELDAPLRLCVVLSYNEGMSHREIAAATGLPLGTVKTHIRNGAAQLQTLLAAYDEASGKEGSA